MQEYNANFCVGPLSLLYKKSSSEQQKIKAQGTLVSIENCAL